MEILEAFKKYLEAENTSKSTIKNYRADVGQFVRWFEAFFQSTFNPSSVNHITLDLYSKHQKLSARSAKRHISSLRKFFTFAKERGLELQEDLFKVKDQLAQEDPLSLKEFKMFLANNNASSLTIKNYLMDARQFLDWTKNLNPDTKLSYELVEEYKNRLIATGFSVASVNRKLSAIRKLFDYKEIKLPPFSYLKDQKAIFDRETFLKEHTSELTPSRESLLWDFGPVRLIGRASRVFSLGFDVLFALPASKVIGKSSEFIWGLRGKPIFYGTAGAVKVYKKTGIENIKKETYAPELISTQYFPIHKKILFALAHKRPQWYKRYQSYQFVPYLHASILFLFCVITALVLYHRLYPSNQPQSVLGTKASEQTRIITLKARLTDTHNLPITDAPSIRLSLYNDALASGSALIWQDVIQNLTPDPDGTFTLALGKNKPLPQSVFSENYQTYLGITVGTNPELTPRQQLPSSSYAANADTVQGLLPLTVPNSGTANVLLALDSSGNLAIGGNANPIFSATGGEFTLQGQQLRLATNIGSSGDVVVSPDGTGMLDIQKPIHNSSNYNNDLLSPGAVEVDDSLSVLATSSAQSALTVNQNGTGKLISGYNNSSAKFSVDSYGNANFAGSIGIGTEFPLQTLDVRGNIYLGNTSPTIYLGAKNYISFDTSKTIIYGSVGDIVVHPATGAAFRPFYDNMYALGNSSYRWKSLTVGDGTSSFDGKVGIGTHDPTASLQIQKDSNGNAALAIVEQGSGDLITASSSSGNQFVVNNQGSLGIGTATPSAPLSVVATRNNSEGGVARVTNLNQTDSADNTALALRLGVGSDSKNARFIQFYTDSTSDLSGNGAGRIRSTGSVGSPAVAYESGAADFAEYFDKALPAGRQGEDLEQGDIVELDSQSQAIKALSSQAIFGVVSKTGAFVGNLPKANEQNKVIVGLLGQIDVKVNTQHGAIVKNDLITLSEMPGIGAKAIDAGKVLGRAMEGFDGQNGTSCQKDPSYRCGMIKVLVSPSWFDPQVYLTQEGNLNITKNEATQTYSLSDSTGNLITRIGAFEYAAIANLKAGLIQAQQLIADTVIVNTKIISPVADIDRIHTGIISAVEPNSQIAIEVKPDKIAITNQTGSEVVQINNQGDASFSGKLNSNSLQTNEATIAGTLHAGTIFADNIIGNITPNSQLPTASISSQLNSVVADTGQFNLGLIALGPSAMTDLTVSNQLSVGTNLTLSDNSINVLGGELALQPLKLGGISFEGGLVAIDTDGNLTVKGNVSVFGTLSANILSPVPDKDLAIQLNSSPTHDSQFVIQNSSGSAVFAVNQNGDVQSNSVNTNKLNFSLVQPAFAVSNIEAIASGSAGTASIKPHQVELTIKNPAVNKDSLIYITPVGTPSGQIPFLQRQIEHDSFTVGIEIPEFSETYFNWLIIN